ncbi:MAG: hypothetical protein AAGD25_31535 [Cyanobacteria bacterium P01_F01_bin.150]
MYLKVGKQYMRDAWILFDRTITITSEITVFGRTAVRFLEELKNWVEQHQIWPFAIV